MWVVTYSICSKILPHILKRVKRVWYQHRKGGDSLIDHVGKVHIHAWGSWRSLNRKTEVDDHSLNTKVDGEDEEQPEPSICCPLGGGEQVDDEKTEALEDNCVQPDDFTDHQDIWHWTFTIGHWTLNIGNRH